MFVRNTSTQLVYHEDGSNRFLHNVDTNLSNYASSSDITTTPIIDMLVTVNLLRVFNATYVYNLGRPRLWWMDDVREDLRRMGVTNCRLRAHRRDDLKMVVKEARVLQGL